MNERKARRVGLHEIMIKLSMWNVLVRLGFDGCWNIGADEEAIGKYERLMKETGRGDASVVSNGCLWGESHVVKGRMES